MFLAAAPGRVQLRLVDHPELPSRSPGTADVHCDHPAASRRSRRTPGCDPVTTARPPADPPPAGPDVPAVHQRICVPAPASCGTSASSYHPGTIGPPYEHCQLSGRPRPQRCWSRHVALSRWELQPGEEPLGGGKVTDYLPDGGREPPYEGGHGQDLVVGRHALVVEQVYHVDVITPLQIQDAPAVERSRTYPAAEVKPPAPAPAGPRPVPGACRIHPREDVTEQARPMWARMDSASARRGAGNSAKSSSTPAPITTVISPAYKGTNPECPGYR